MNIQRFLARECNAEFGPNHEHDEVECPRIIALMKASSLLAYYEFYDDGLAYALNRAAEEDRLGRPLFPNEY